MRRLVLSAYGFQNAYYFPGLLRETKEDTVCLIQNKETFREGMRFDDFEDVWIVDGYFNNAAVEAIAYQAARKGLGAVIATNEQDMLLASKLRTIFDIQGLKEEKCLLFRDKFIMQSFFSANSVAVPPFRRVDMVTDAYDFAEKNGFPVVLKPRRGAGSKGVVKIDTLARLQEWASAISATVSDRDAGLNFIAEGFVDGAEGSINGFVLQADEIFCWPTRHTSSELKLVRDGEALLYWLLPACDPDFVRLRSFGKSVISAAGLTYCAFHMQFFMTEDRVLLCEVAARTSGQYQSNMWKQAFGIDLHEASFLLQGKIGLEALRDKAVAMEATFTAQESRFAYALIPEAPGLRVQIGNWPHIAGVSQVFLSASRVLHEQRAEINDLGLMCILSGTTMEEVRCAFQKVEDAYRRCFTHVAINLDHH